MYFSIFAIVCLIFISNVSSKTTRYEPVKKFDPSRLINSKDGSDVKNTIEDFETHFACFFQPDFTKLDQLPKARHATEIRRQKWEYIFHKLTNSYMIKELDSRLQKADIDRSTFCGDIAAAHFQLSSNGSIVRNCLRAKSLQVFLSFISDLKFDPNKFEEMVQIPKSMYVDLLFRDSHLICANTLASNLKRYHEDEIARLKKKCREKIWHTRDHPYDSYEPDSELASGDASDGSA